MLTTVDLRETDLDDYTDAVPRAEFNVERAVDAVRPICEAVKAEGIDALRRFSEKFDHVVPEHFRVPKHALDNALKNLDPNLRAAIEEAIRRRREVCRQAELEEGPKTVALDDGAVVTDKLIPVRRVGLYVPGGLAPLASSVLMNVVPAQVAGVGSLAVATPPQSEFGGLPHPTTLAVCSLLGVEEVYAVGGAQAVAMFAYGVSGLCPRADLVTGPGNIFVVAAKRYLRGRVGIDSEAGPTEIGILADSSANPAFVAADLISQAEHDPMAASVLVTDSEKLAASVKNEVARQVDRLETRDRLKEALSGQQSAIVLVRDIEQGLDVVNDYGAEHLEIQTADSQEVADRVSNAGAIFVGSYSPVPLGDYSAGSTHVLPTGGAARYSSGLNVRSFMRSVHLINYDRAALARIGAGIQDFAHAERLPGHAYAIAVRTQEDK